MSIKSWWRAFIERGGDLTGRESECYDPGATTRTTPDGVQIDGRLYLVKSNDLHVYRDTIMSCWYFQGGGVCRIQLRRG